MAWTTDGGRRGSAIFTYEFGTVEWMWTEGTIRVNLPGGYERVHQQSGFPEVVEVLSALGATGWDVATNAAAGNWLFWTLRRPR
ncbi:hypothetical protein [Umezawaea sp. Da 62-37]|uniref:hypothetical protein n=1 Tax=Umezawaea sp. Da 62-37 TaxID=3075927 RepID=UPI0028F6CEFA|nr:hypothetical protein [Umezawaea sp. Da 62-37]WNV89466.1 hypothetical protein RM788_14540 [Umezawaea sp. Da 62-37]